MSTHTSGKLVGALGDDAGLCRTKRRLMVVVGAGASIDFGMPSVNGVAKILLSAAQERYPLFENSATNLYKYFENTLIA